MNSNHSSDAQVVAAVDDDDPCSWCCCSCGCGAKSASPDKHTGLFEWHHHEPHSPAVVAEIQRLKKLGIEQHATAASFSLPPSAAASSSASAANIVPRAAGNGSSSVLRVTPGGGAAAANSRHHHHHSTRTQQPTTGATTKVQLNVYHLVDPETNLSMLKVGMGIFHAGVVINGREYSYGIVEAEKGEATGLFVVRPGTAAGDFFKTLDLGVTMLSREQIDTVVRRMRVEYRAAEYHILGRNCCSFCHDMCRRLSTRGNAIKCPEWISRMARVSDKLFPRDFSAWVIRRYVEGPEVAAAAATEADSRNKNSNDTSNKTSTTKDAGTSCLEPSSSSASAAAAPAAAAEVGAVYRTPAKKAYSNADDEELGGKEEQTIRTPNGTSWTIVAETNQDFQHQRVLEQRSRLDLASARVVPRARSSSEQRRKRSDMKPNAVAVSNQNNKNHNDDDDDSLTDTSFEFDKPMPPELWQGDKHFELDNDDDAQQQEQQHKLSDSGKPHVHVIFSPPPAEEQLPRRQAVKQLSTNEVMSPANNDENGDGDDLTISSFKLDGDADSPPRRVVAQQQQQHHLDPMASTSAVVAAAATSLDETPKPSKLLRFNTGAFETPAPQLPARNGGGAKKKTRQQDKEHGEDNDTNSSKSSDSNSNSGKRRSNSGVLQSKTVMNSRGGVSRVQRLNAAFPDAAFDDESTQQQHDQQQQHETQQLSDNDDRRRMNAESPDCTTQLPVPRHHNDNDDEASGSPRNGGAATSGGAGGGDCDDYGDNSTHLSALQRIASGGNVCNDQDNNNSGNNNLMRQEHRQKDDLVGATEQQQEQPPQQQKQRHNNDADDYDDGNDAISSPVPVALQQAATSATTVASSSNGRRTTAPPSPSSAAGTAANNNNSKNVNGGGSSSIRARTRVAAASEKDDDEQPASEGRHKNQINDLTATINEDGADEDSPSPMHGAAAGSFRGGRGIVGGGSSRRSPSLPQALRSGGGRGRNQNLNEQQQQERQQRQQQQQQLEDSRVLVDDQATLSAGEESTAKISMLMMPRTETGPNPRRFALGAVGVNAHLSNLGGIGGATDLTSLSAAAAAAGVLSLLETQNASVDSARSVTPNGSRVDDDIMTAQGPPR